MQQSPWNCTNKPKQYSLQGAELFQGWLPKSGLQVCLQSCHSRCWGQVKTFVELVGSLLSASSGGSGPLSRGPRPGAGPSLEMARAMKEAGVVKALTDALALMDLDHPKVSFFFCA